MQQGEMGSQFRRVLEPSNGQEGMRVRSQTLTEIIFGISGTIDLLKMDIEGSEYPALFSCPPALFGRVRRMVMEFHPLYKKDEPQPGDLFTHLACGGLITDEVQDHGEGYGVAYLRQKSAIAV